jgi:tetratricopeptide (TPR) repeat protein
LTSCGDSEASNRRLVETGKKYFANGKFKEASLIFRKAISKDARYGEAYYQLGLTQLKLGRYAQALGALRRASELQPENDDAHARLGDLYLAIYASDRKRHKQFLTDLEDLGGKILKRNPKSFEGLRIKGYLAVSREDFPAAAAAFRDALAIKPDNGSTALAYVQSLGNSKALAEAESTARAFIEKEKSFGPMYDYLYVLKAREKKIEDAESALQLKVKNNPKQPMPRLELAVHHLRANQRDKAKSVLDQLAGNRADFPNGRELVGDLYYRLGDLDTAYQQYQASLNEARPNKLSLQRKMVEVLAFQSRNQEATKLADQVLKENPSDDTAKALRASLRLRGGDRKELDTALSELQSVIARMPDNHVVRFNYGEALMAKGQIGQAKVQFQEAIKLRPNYGPPKMALAYIHLRERDYTRVLTLADEVLKLTPGMVAARILRAAGLIGNGDRGKARQELEELVQRSPDKESRYLLAMLDFGDKRWSESEAGFRSLWEANPPDFRGLFGIVETMMATNRAPAARQLLEKTLAGHQAHSATIRMAIANVAARSNDQVTAVNTYEQLVKEIPDSQEMWLRLGRSYKKVSRLDDAYRAFEKARGVDPRQVAPWLEMAVVLETQNRKGQVKPIYEEILKLAPDNPVALNNLAYILAENSVDLDQALTYAQRARQKLPNHPDIADTLGWVYIKKNLSDDAIKIFRDLLTGKPEHVTWRYHLAMALYQKGDKLQARRELETALRNKPTKDEDTKIRELLSRLG